MQTELARNTSKKAQRETMQEAVINEKAAKHAPVYPKKVPKEMFIPKLTSGNNGINVYNENVGN